jgi:hypothetical protein
MGANYYKGSSVINEAKVLRKQESMKALRMHQRGTVGRRPKLREQTTFTRLGAFTCYELDRYEILD